MGKRKKTSRQTLSQSTKAKVVTRTTDRTPIRVFRGFSRLYTLAEAARKQGRRIVAEDLSVIESAALVEHQGRIVWVGPEKRLPKKWATGGKGIEEIHLGARVGIPALVESHTHLIYAGNRAAEFERRNQGESYQSIARSGGGILSTMSHTRKAKPSDLRKLAQERVERFLRQGVTTIEAKSGYALEVEEEFKMLRVAKELKRARVVPTFLGAHAIPPEFASAEPYIDHLIQEALPRLKSEGLATRVDIFVENGYFPAELAKRYLKAALDEGLDVAVHADQLTHSGGAFVATELASSLRRRSVAQVRSAEHLLCIDEKDIDRLAASDVTCVLLPSADLYMNSPYPPARALIDKGARVALATDFNPGSAPSQDVALVGILARVQMKMSLPEVLAAYTVGGAFALGLETRLGSLEAGKLCDFVVLSGGLEEVFLEVGRMPIKNVYREGVRLV